MAIDWNWETAREYLTTENGEHKLGRLKALCYLLEAERKRVADEAAKIAEAGGASFTTALAIRRLAEG